jgi:two-component system, NarL family, response regulator LiaR
LEGSAAEANIVNPIRIALVDDHRVVTRSLKAYLESFADLQVVGTAASAEELLEHLSAWRPDVVLQDLLMPGGLDGIRTTARILERAPATRVIALTASIDEARMIGVLRAGAAGYVRKDAEPETLLAAVRAVAAGRTFLDPAVATMLAASHVADDLTTREREVLRELVLGKSNKEIGSALGIGEQTVKSHVARLLAKLAVENRGQAAIEALKRGIVSLEELQ